MTEDMKMKRRWRKKDDDEEKEEKEEKNGEEMRKDQEEVDENIHLSMFFPTLSQMASLT